MSMETKSLSLRDTLASPDGRLIVGAVGVYLAVLLLYLPTMLFNFVPMDDPQYVFENPHVRSGLAWSNLAWALTELHGEVSYWHPLTWISHQLDCQLFGLNSGAHHLVSALIHMFNSLLAMLLCRKLGLASGPSVFLGAMFAVHPLHVESVAWIAERKDLLCGTFYLTSMILYADYRNSHRGAAYWGSFAAFLCALMSKPAAVSLPVVLALMEVLLPAISGESPRRRTGMVRRILPIAPFALASAASAMLTLVGQRQIGTIQSFQALPLDARLDNAWVSYLAYVVRTTWPVGLCATHGPIAGSAVWGLPALALLLAVSAVLWWRRTKFPLAAFGWFAFLIMLLPSIGLVQVGPQASADRYMYLPLLALGWVVVDLMAPLLRSTIGARWIHFGAAAAALLALAATSSRQVMYWQDGVSLFSRAVSIEPGFWFARLGLGTALTASHRHREAESWLRSALEMPGNAAETHRILGLCLTGQRRFQEASEQLRTSLDLKPNPRAKLLLAKLYCGENDPSIKNPALAVSLSRDALRDLGEPDGEAWLTAAVAQATAGNYELASEHLARAENFGLRNGDPMLVRQATVRKQAWQYWTAPETAGPANPPPPRG